MGTRINLLGKVFGRLTVIAIAPTIKKGTKTIGYWLCKCDCGKVLKVSAPCLTRKEFTKSCGCYKSDVTAERNFKHGFSGTSEYNIWIAMRERCFNTNCAYYPDYGGRGITVCERWKKSFENFLADMGSKPEGFSIDRRNNNGNYEPTNCYWATNRQQALNRRPKSK